MQYTAQQAADMIGVPARSLRRHIRQSESWKAAGFGGRYMFSETDIRSLRRELRGTSSRQGVTRSERVSDPREALPELNTRELLGRTSVEELGTRKLRDKNRRRDIEARYDKRQAKLLARLHEVEREGADA